MLKGELINNKVIVKGGEEFYKKGLYGNLKGDVLELDLIEALFLAERGRIQIIVNGKGISIKDFYHFCCKQDGFEYKYIVYKDLRGRGLPVRMGFKGCDFRVYERGTKFDKMDKVKWIVFSAAEDYPCNMDQLGRAIKLAKNIRTTALWAVVDNDSDVTYYIINQAENL